MCFANHPHLLPPHASPSAVRPETPAADRALTPEQRHHVTEMITEAESSGSRIGGTARPSPRDERKALRRTS